MRRGRACPPVRAGGPGQSPSPPSATQSSPEGATACSLGRKPQADSQPSEKPRRGGSRPLGTTPRRYNLRVSRRLLAYTLLPPYRGWICGPSRRHALRRDAPTGSDSEPSAHSPGVVSTPCGQTPSQPLSAPSNHTTSRLRRSYPVSSTNSRARATCRRAPVRSPWSRQRRACSR